MIFRVLIAAGVVLCATGCDSVYIMDGTVSLSTPIDPTIEQAASETMHEAHLDVSVSPDIADHPVSFVNDRHKGEGIANEQFIVNPKLSLGATAQYLNSLSQCGQAEPSCKVVTMYIDHLAWLPGMFSDEGFWTTDVYLAITAHVVIGDEHSNKTCWVSSFGPQHFFHSSPDMNQSFQIAARHVFIKGLVCLATPDSRFNLPDRAQYISGHASPL